MDRLAVHRSPTVRAVIEARGARLRLLPAYSPDFNPIEPACGLVKKRLRKLAARTGPRLRTAAHRACRVVTPIHCQRWFAHAGYVKSTANRD